MSKEKELSKEHVTDAGIEINRIYKEPIIINEDAGEFPYTRGVQPART